MTLDPVDIHTWLRGGNVALLQQCECPRRAEALQLLDVSEVAAPHEGTTEVVLIHFSGGRGIYYECSHREPAEQMYWRLAGDCGDALHWSSILTTQLDYTTTGVYSPSVWFLTSKRDERTARVAEIRAYDNRDR